MSYFNNSIHNSTSITTTTTTTTLSSSSSSKSNIPTINRENVIDENSLPIIKLDFEDVPLLNFDIDDFIKEQDLVLKDQKKNTLFQELIQPLRESYQEELNLIDGNFNMVQSEIISAFPTGYYPKDVLDFIESHVRYNQLLCLKTKAALRSKVFDSIQHIFQTHISLATSIDNSGNNTLNQDVSSLETQATETSDGSENRGNDCNGTRKKKRKVDEILEKWYSTNYTQPYPLYSDKIFLASFSKISKTKVEEWFGNKRTRVRKQVKSDDSNEKTINKNIISSSTHKKKRGTFVY